MMKLLLGMASNIFLLLGPVISVEIAEKAFLAKYSHVIQSQAERYNIEFLANMYNGDFIICCIAVESVFMVLLFVFSGVYFYFTYCENPRLYDAPDAESYLVSGALEMVAIATIICIIFFVYVYYQNYIYDIIIKIL